MSLTWAVHNALPRELDPEARQPSRANRVGGLDRRDQPQPPAAAWPGQHDDVEEPAHQSAHAQWRTTPEHHARKVDLLREDKPEIDPFSLAEAKASSPKAFRTRRSGATSASRSSPACDPTSRSAFRGTT